MKLTEISPWFKKFLWRRWYQYLAGYRVSDWRFMNYGYASLDPEAPTIPLEPADEPNRYSIQLYHHVASRVNLTGLNVLEVGSGRGGGASYVKRYLHPQTMTGVDFSPQAVRFCQEQHQAEGLTFVQGDAESLPFADASFDAVLNVESSHCYSSVPAFLGQVKRVLRPGGHFLFADLRMAKDLERLQQSIQETGLTIVEYEVITPQVSEALRRDSERKQALMETFISKYLRSTFRQFAAIKGSEIYDGFANGTAVYVRYLLRK